MLQNGETRKQLRKDGKERKWTWALTIHPAVKTG